MKLAKLNIKVNKALNTGDGAKLLGGIALGAMLMTAVALPIGGTTYADDPARVLTTAVDYGDEFVFERWGGTTSLSAKVTPSTTNYADMEEFELTEQGQVAAKVTLSTTNYADMEEFELTELGQVAARLTPSTVNYGDKGI